MGTVDRKRAQKRAFCRCAYISETVPYVRRAHELWRWRLHASSKYQLSACRIMWCHNSEGHNLNRHLSENIWTSMSLFYKLFDILIGVVMKSSIFWDITMCNLVKVNWHFRGTCSLYLWSWRVSQARSQNEAGRKHSSTWRWKQCIPQKC
jgi:hypothetical protein